MIKGDFKFIVETETAFSLFVFPWHVSGKVILPICFYNSRSAVNRRLNIYQSAKIPITAN